MSFNKQEFLNLTFNVNDMSIIDAAHAYYDCGIQVVPFYCELNQYGMFVKKPVYIKGICEGWKKSPITDKNVLTTIFESNPQYFIAIVIPEYISIIDVDPRNNGDVNQDFLYDSLVTLTPSGGVHSWRTMLIQHSCTQLPDYPGIDFKSYKDGLIIVPPSIRPDYPGESYIFVNQKQGLHPMPLTIAAALVKPKVKQRIKKLRNPYSIKTANPDWLINDMRNTHEGQRNIKFFNYMCLFLESKNISDDDIKNLYQAALDAGLEASQVAASYHSALERVKI